MNRQLMPRVNFKAYRKRQYMEACYSAYGRGVYFRGQKVKRESCPICKKEDSRSRCFSWSFETCSFYCHSCKAKGDALELVMRMEFVDVIGAAKWLEEKAGPAGSGLVTAQETA